MRLNGWAEEHKFLGRTTIFTSRTKDQINADTIPDIINGAMMRHIENRRETLYLKRYFRGDQPILQRVKKIRPDVNNRIVINNSYSIVRNGNGYFLGEPIQFTAKEQSDSDKVKSLNTYMDSENKAYEDMSLGNDASICGRGFRLIAADRPEEEDEAPFEIPTLDAEDTEVIYSTQAGHTPMLAFTHAPILSDNGNASGTEWTVYDGAFQYIYAVPGSFGSQLKRSNLTAVHPHFLKDVPIVEYPNNEWRIGDFEIVLTILDAINKLHSDRVNSVEQVVNSILVFIGCHLKTKEENEKLGNGSIADYDSLKENGAIELPNADGAKADVKYVFSQVDQNEAETLAQTLIDYVYAITGIPDRKERSNGGGDTGDAVYLRDGFQSLEIVARVKERNFKKAERVSLRMICEVLRRFSDIDLKPMQIDVKFIRNRTNNLLNKSQAATYLQKSGYFAPEDVIALIGVTDDPKQMAERGQSYRDAQAEKVVAGSKETQPGGDGQNADDSTDTQSVAAAG